jgi:hypothetical protein
MPANKFTIRPNNFVDNQINIPISLNWDYLGLEQSIDEYEKEIITDVIGVGRDFEVTRFSHAPTSTENTDINYEFYFYSGGSMNEESNWRINYISEGFTPQEIYYYTNNFTNSFFKLDLYDAVDEKKQTNYVTIIIPTQQGLKMDTMMQRTPVSIKKPKFILDYVGDKEGFFIYWLKKRNFLDISTFYMTAKFYNSKSGVFTKMMNAPQSSLGNKFSFDSTQYFYYGVQLNYEKHSYEIININPNQTGFGTRVGTTAPIKWYEYVNPTR